MAKAMQNLTNKLSARNSHTLQNQFGWWGKVCSEIGKDLWMREVLGLK